MGDTSIFFRSWYRRVLDDRIHRNVDEKTVWRAFDEINEFDVGKITAEAKAYKSGK